MRLLPLICLLIVISAVTASATIQYQLVDLGTLGGYSLALGINDRGQVVGYSYLNPGNRGPFHAFIWEAGTGMQDLGTLGGSDSYARGINDKGQVVGSSFIAGNTANHAFLWQSSTGMQDIGLLWGTNSSASAINNRGQVVGSSNEGSFLWQSSTGVHYLGNLGFPRCGANDINDSGQVVGSSFSDRDNYNHAFLWQEASGMLDLGTIAPGFAIANGINSKGQVVGTSSWNRNISYLEHAFLWQDGLGMQDLGSFGGIMCQASSINDKSQVAGWSALAGNNMWHAFLWQSGFGLQDIGLPLDGFASEAIAINNKAWIAGNTVDASSGAYQAVLWIPVPEPPIMITIDIKPGTFPNNLNLRSKGMVPVAIISTTDFGASKVDPSTVQFAGASPSRWAPEDVDGDGDIDMIFHFDQQDLNLTRESVRAELTGKTIDDQSIQGVDSVRIVPPK